MFSDDTLMERLVLKGGNLLDIVYKLSTRASVDVDLSIDGDFESFDDLNVRVERAIRLTYAEIDLVAFDINIRSVPPRLSDDMKSFWGGYKIDFKLIESARYRSFEKIDDLRRNSLSIGKRGSSKFCIDLSRHEYCESKRAELLEGYTIFVYTPEMFVCEKLRAICQQMPAYVTIVRSHPSARARDFVDIEVMCDRFDLDFNRAEFRDILLKTFEVKKVPLSLIARISEQREFHRADFSAVLDTVKPNVKLEAFDFYFDYVLAKCEALKPLWNE